MARARRSTQQFEDVGTLRPKVSLDRFRIICRVAVGEHSHAPEMGHDVEVRMPCQDGCCNLWRMLEAVELARLEWVEWFNNRRLLEPIGNVSSAEAEARYYTELGTLPMAA